MNIYFKPWVKIHNKKRQLHSFTSEDISAARLCQQTQCDTFTDPKNTLILTKVKPLSTSLPTFVFTTSH